MPNTERVVNLKKVEEVLIFSQVEGKRNWEQVIRTTLRERYTCNAAQMSEMVQMCLFALDNNRVPTCVMDKFREAKQFNAMSVLK